ncbi:hypothetical protein AB4559_08275 [Vibrio sp. 10N.222.51.C8]|jgi:predicted transposase YbfD/YdcC|uniref:Uncharacterized protein n=2 Tax=Vibrio cyclitrophicus TaxID=47951 RepID=A0A7Z1S1B8_9VIBR|nr:hypothetical protein [Vibrio cyclitrophicus]PMP16507.1 hypothetical protein BCS91_26120 [Vibrio cyclitrophicus]PMP26719.1 hypothetical protein BCS90_23080 [Vibrio cyclitrophicus]
MNNLTFETWVESFKPIINENGGSAIFLDEKCISFETYGNDLETIKKTDASRVWTIIEIDVDEEEDELGEPIDSKWVIVNGCHWVNRVAYIITQTPWQDGSDYEITYD